MLIYRTVALFYVFRRCSVSSGFTGSQFSGLISVLVWNVPWHILRPSDPIYPSFYEEFMQAWCARLTSEVFVSITEVVLGHAGILPCKLTWPASTNFRKSSLVFTLTLQICTSLHCVPLISLGVTALGACQWRAGQAHVPLFSVSLLWLL